jgi:hypothetical protein
MSTRIIHKRGDTFDRLLAFPEADYPNGFFLLWDAASQLRTTSGRLIAELTVEWADPAATTRILRLFNNETDGWPLGLHELDVEFVRQADGVVRSTETIEVEVIKDATRPLT